MMRALTVMCLLMMAAMLVVSKPPKRCRLSKVIGPCRAAFERYHYNSATGSCEKFLYGGCKGNKNNFVSKKECKKTCKVKDGQ